MADAGQKPEPPHSKGHFLLTQIKKPAAETAGIASDIIPVNGGQNTARCPFEVAA